PSACALRDPAPPAPWAEVGLWWCGATPPSTETEDLDVKVCEDAVTSASTHGNDCREAVAAGNGQSPSAAESRSGLEAVSRHRDAAIARRCDDCRDDESHGLAAAFGARIPCRRGEQAPQAQARVEEGGRHSGLPDRWRGKRQAQASQVRAPVVLSAMPRVRVAPALPDRKTLDGEIARLRDLDVGGLRGHWHHVFGRRPHPSLPRLLLFRVLAYRLQADVLGDLDGESRRLLDRFPPSSYLARSKGRAKDRADAGQAARPCPCDHNCSVRSSGRRPIAPSFGAHWRSACGGDGRDRG